MSLDPAAGTSIFWCMEKQGVNTLYLAMGMLSWREYVERVRDHRR
jgi:hypothetical protein